MHGVCFVDDPFEFSIGSVDLKTGRFLGPLLYRGFIVQDMLTALMMLEPRTPKSSFYFRGPAAFEKDASGQTVFSFNGTVRVPYPEGFGFPHPDLKSTFTVGPNSALDPYLYYPGDGRDRAVARRQVGRREERPGVERPALRVQLLDSRGIPPASRRPSSTSTRAPAARSAWAAWCG